MAQDKTIVFNIAMAGIEPGVMIYDKLMRGFIGRKYNVRIPDFKETFSSKCWGCGRESEEIKHDGEAEKGNMKDIGAEKSLNKCSGCGVARWQLANP